MPDVFAQTVATYCSPAGAAAYVAKERRNAEGRNADSYSLLKGVPLAGQRVLDVGCGFGRDVAFFRQQGAAAFGCDISPALLAQADPAIQPFLAVYDVLRGADFPFEGPFDMVWSMALLVHIPRAEMPELVQKMWAALAPGGSLILATKGGEGERVMTNLGADLPRIMVHYMPSEILAVLEPLGALVVRAHERRETPIPTGDWMMELILRKPS